MSRSFLFDVLFASATLLLATLLFTALAVSMAHATPPPDDLGGQIKAEHDGREIQFPVLKTEVVANVNGDLADVTVIQTFLNPTSEPLNATYLFPLNKDAAVHAMTMRVGDELITAQIRKREEARKTFEAAKRQGKGAALLEQHRPNMFTQSVANLMPGQPVKITLRYVQPVPRIDGDYELVVPLVVGPRYIPLGGRDARTDPRLVALLGNDGDDQTAPMQEAHPEQEEAAGVDGWQFRSLPQYPEVSGLTIPKQVDSARVSIKVRLAAGMEINAVSSRSHRIDVSGGVNEKSIALRAGKIIDNRDFVLSYTIAGQSVQAGVLTHRDKAGGYLSLMLEPPAVTNAGSITPREIVFILDTSGSMHGVPMAASKAFMRHALMALNQNDYFRIVRFSNEASEFASAPVRATPENLQRGLTFVDGLRTGGGTEVLSGLEKAFAMPQAARTRRLIVFLSDGYVGNEGQIIQMVSRNIGKARTYALGVGTAVNRYLLGEMAHHGRGYVRFIDPTEDVEEAAAGFAKKIANTVMTDVEIDWGDLEVSDVVPAALPDLFAGDSLRVHARFAGAGEHTISIKGKIGGKAAKLPVRLRLPEAETGEATKAVALGWARATVKDLMRELMSAGYRRQSGLTTSDLKQRVTAVGLRHALVTQWTSFVAVSQKILNPEPLTTPDVAVPLAMVKGVGPGAYGIQGTLQRAGRPANKAAGHRTVRIATSSFKGHSGGGNGSMGTGFAGGATPEPEQILGLLVVLLTLLGFGGRLIGMRKA